MLLVILSSIIYSLMASENVVVMMHKTPTTREENASKSNFKEVRERELERRCELRANNAPARGECTLI